MAFKLFDYQEESYEAARDNMRSGYFNNLFIAPCGSGKGTLLSYCGASTVAKGGRTMVLAHRGELVSGSGAIDDRLVSQMGVPRDMIGYVMSGREKRVRPFLLGTVQSASSRNLPPIDHLLVDEAHRIQTNSYQKVLKHLYSRNPKMVLSGFTATPKRLDGKSLLDVFDKPIQVTTTRELISRRFLVPEVTIAPIDEKINLSSIGLRGGDYIQSELREVYTDEVISSMVDVWEEYARDRKTMIFTINDMSMAKSIAAHIQARGYTAVSITSDDKPNIRAAKLKAYKQNKIQVCVNVNLFTEGIDDVHTSCVAMMMATKSETRYIQAASRGGRPIWNKNHTDWQKDKLGYLKENYLLLDFGQNWLEHGRVCDYGAEGFDLEVKPKNKLKEPAPVKKCPQCYTVVPIQSRSCPDCGYEFPIQSDIDGILATDATWEIVDPNYAFFKKFVMLTEKQILNGLRTRKIPEYLIPIGKVKGFPDYWPIHAAADLGYFTGRNPKLSTEDYEAIRVSLTRSTKRNGLWGVVDEINKRQIGLR